MYGPIHRVHEGNNFATQLFLRERISSYLSCLPNLTKSDQQTTPHRISWRYMANRRRRLNGSYHRGRHQTKTLKRRSRTRSPALDYTPSMYALHSIEAAPIKSKSQKTPPPSPMRRRLRPRARQQSSAN